MKTKKILMIGFMLATWSASAQSFKEKITRELAFEKKGPANALMVFNINGDVIVEGYSGDKIIIEAQKSIYGKTDSRLEKGKAEIQLGVLDRADTLLVYVEGVCSEFGKINKKKNWRSKWNNWGYQWSDCGRGCNCNNKEYDYTMDIKIKVPASVNVLTSTVNDGDIEIAGVTGYVLADNVNGNVRLKNISGATHASTINGSVDLDYSSNPPGDSRYYSLNGDINAYFKKGLAAQLTFKSFNGDFYSSVNEITPMAVSVEKYEKEEGIRYRVNGNRYKVRQGGPLLDFETFNGDVFLKEKEN